MLKRRLILTGIMLLSFHCTLWAADFYVEYIDGIVDVQAGEDWEELFIGDTIDSSSVLRIEEDSMVELTASGATVTLSRPGVYNLKNIAGEVAQRERIGLSTIVSGKLSTVFTGSKAVVQSTAGGVRGEEAGSETSSIWMESDVQELIEAGKAAAADGDFDQALELFEEAYDNAFDPVEESEASFFIASAYDALGQQKEALDILSTVELPPDNSLYADSFLLRGKLLLQSFEYKELIMRLSDFDTAYAPKEDGQTIFLMVGVAFLGLDKETDARSFFEKANALDPESDAGMAAAQMLEAL